MNKVILIIILSLLCHVTMAVDVDKETFNSLTYANGLAGETVRNMDVDHHGQIWMATGAGLTVFNGVRAHSYRFYCEKLKGNAKVYDVCEGLGNSIFVGTSEGVYEYST
jgi:ligand-binding sensor domain-containing protein